MEGNGLDTNCERVKRIEQMCRERGPAMRAYLASLLPDPLAEQAHGFVLRVQHLIEHGENGSDSVGETTHDVEPAPLLP